MADVHSYNNYAMDGSNKWHILHRSDSIRRGESTIVTLHISIVRIIMKEVGSATGTTHIRLK